MRGILSDDEGLLSKTVDEWPAPFDVDRNPGGDDEKLARFGCIRIPEDRSCDVALPIPRMFAGSGPLSRC